MNPNGRRVHYYIVEALPLFLSLPHPSQPHPTVKLGTGNMNWIGDYWRLASPLAINYRLHRQLSTARIFDARHNVQIQV